jgi:glutamyl-tRNA reductase
MVMALVGASHHDVTLEELERLSAAAPGLARRLVDASDDVVGATVLATCNRFEVYLDLGRFHDAVELTTRMVADQAGLPHGPVADSMRVVVGSSVPQHLFSVAAGLESMVVGEDEIAGQVRDALALAHAERTTSPALERMLQQALATSKAVTRSTGLGAAGRSIVSVGLDLVEKRYGPVSGRRALVFGTGAYARIVVAALQRRGCADIGVYSSAGRAAPFAASHHVEAVELSALPELLGAADLVAACSGAPHYLLDLPLARAAGLDARAVMPFLDLALSPDVAPEVRDLPSVDIVDLRVIGEHAPPEHAAAILEAQDIVLSAVRDFEDGESGRTADHAVVAMRAHVMAIIAEEIERIQRRVDGETAEEVARALTRVSNAILHTPSVRAQELARTGNFADYRKAVHTLFGIDVDADA